MANFDVHDIIIPYIVRFTWGSGDAQATWETRLAEARQFLKAEYSMLLVHSGLTDWAPIHKESATTMLGRGTVANLYASRWSTDERVVKNMPHLYNWCGVYGDYEGSLPSNRWDVLRDLWQMALAPDCCKAAYFNTQMKDPYLELYGHGDDIKRLKSSGMNSLLAPLGLFLSPIVPCSLDCPHAHAKAEQIEAIVKEANPDVYATLKLIMEMPLRLDSYRGLVMVDTPMFKGVYASDALKEKKVLSVRPEHPTLFNYQDAWVVKGSDFPYKSKTTELLELVFS